MEGSDFKYNLAIKYLPNKISGSEKLLYRKAHNIKMPVKMLEKGPLACEGKIALQNVAKTKRKSLAPVKKTQSTVLPLLSFLPWAQTLKI